MADSQTDNLSLTKPEIEGSPDTWGEKLNENMDLIDAYTSINRMVLQTALQTGKSTGALPDIKGENPVNLTEEEFRTAAQPLFYADAVTIPSDAPGVLVTQNWVLKLFDLIFPIGTIMLWGMPAGTAPPAGWTMCNGVGVINNAGVLVTPPDLRGRFIMCAPGWSTGSTWSPGHTGGTPYDLAHTHPITVTPSALTIAQLPPHRHIHDGPGTATTTFFVRTTTGGTYTVTGQSGGIGGFATIDPTDHWANGDPYMSGSKHGHTATSSGNVEPSVPLITLAYIMKINQFGYVAP